MPVPPKRALAFISFLLLASPLIEAAIEATLTSKLYPDNVHIPGDNAFSAPLTASLVTWGDNLSELHVLVDNPTGGGAGAFRLGAEVYADGRRREVTLEESSGGQPFRGLTYPVTLSELGIDPAALRSAAAVSFAVTTWLDPAAPAQRESGGRLAAGTSTTETAFVVPSGDQNSETAGVVTRETLERHHGFGDIRGDFADGPLKPPHRGLRFVYDHADGLYGLSPEDSALVEEYDHDGGAEGPPGKETPVEEYMICPRFAYSSNAHLAGEDYLNGEPAPAIGASLTFHSGLLLPQKAFANSYGCAKFDMDVTAGGFLEVTSHAEIGHMRLDFYESLADRENEVVTTYQYYLSPPGPGQIPFIFLYVPKDKIPTLMAFTMWSLDRLDLLAGRWRSSTPPGPFQEMERRVTIRDHAVEGDAWPPSTSNSFVNIDIAHYTNKWVLAHEAAHVFQTWWAYGWSVNVAHQGYEATYATNEHCWSSGGADTPTDEKWKLHLLQSAEHNVDAAIEGFAQAGAAMAYTDVADPLAMADAPRFRWYRNMADYPSYDGLTANANIVDAAGRFDWGLPISVRDDLCGGGIDRRTSSNEADWMHAILNFAFADDLTDHVSYDLATWMNAWAGMSATYENQPADTLECVNRRLAEQLSPDQAAKWEDVSVTFGIDRQESDGADQCS